MQDMGRDRVRVAGVAVCALAIVLGAGLLCAQEKVIDYTPEKMEALPGHNKMVWVATPMTKKPPTFDGTLDLEHGEYADAACVGGMLFGKSQPYAAALVPIPSQSFVTWDSDHLYLGLRTAVLPGRPLKRTIRNHDLQAHRDDAYEILLDPMGRDQPEWASFQVIVNSLGVCWDAMQSVGVIAKYWESNWQFKSDYEIGKDRFDLEVVIPVKSMRLKRKNASGQCWRFLLCRDWKYLVDGERQKTYWNQYTSFTGWGGFSRPENQGTLVFDDNAPVVQLSGLDAMWEGKLGYAARIHNPHAKPLTCVVETKVLLDDGRKGLGPDADWLTLELPSVVAERKEIMLAPGKAETIAAAGVALPPLAKPEGRAPQQRYAFAMKVTSKDGKTLYYRRQCPFRPLKFSLRPYEYSLPISARYNPVRNHVLATCDVLDYPQRDQAASVRFEFFGAGADVATAKPTVGQTFDTKRQEVFTQIIPVPELKPGVYPVRMALLNKEGKILETKAEATIEKLDERQHFPWYQSNAGVIDEPLPPHKPLRYESDQIVTTMGRFRFAGSALPAEIQMTGHDLLAAPLRLAASTQGRAITFSSPPRCRTTQQTEATAEMTGSITGGQLNFEVATHLEYDGATRITLDLKPNGQVPVDYLRLEIPFRPERAHWLFTMARAGRESWVAADLRTGEGKVWDSANCRGMGMTVGTFMPQVVVNDSERGLCWFADSDRGWVPTDDVPAFEVERRPSETILRFNLIGEPFTVRGPRRIQFWVMGLPSRPLPRNSRIYHRRTDNFGYYVHNKVMNYSPPMPRDLEKARQWMVDGADFHNKTYELIPNKRHGKWWVGYEFAPWHDTHNSYKTPGLHGKTYSYFGLEFEDYGFTPTLLDLRCWQWERYVSHTPIAGIYFDTPERMGFSHSLSTGVGYVIPEGQPKAGQVQPGYGIAGFREQTKRFRAAFYKRSGKDLNPWMEMHATHGLIVPCASFLDMRTEGEDFRTPSYGHFMKAWPVRHLRAIDVPQLYGVATRWLSGLPWDGSVKGVDPIRAKIAACIVHDVWNHWGRWHQAAGARVNSPRGCGVVPDVPPPHGWRNPHVEEKLVALGLNRDETEYLPYWRHADDIQVLRSGNPIKEVRASGWLVPSQRRLIIAVGNWNTYGLRDFQLKVNLEKHGLTPSPAQPNLVVTDLETDQVHFFGSHYFMGQYKLEGSLVPRDPLGLFRIRQEIRPLGFALLMVTLQ